MKNQTTIQSTDSLFGEVIYAYTRTQAIEDGVLVDVTETAKEAGIRFPVALTAAVWADIEAIPGSHSYQDIDGRLWDVLSMFRFAARRTSGRVLNYRIIMHVGRSKYYDLKAICGPGDNGEPVITIMKPNED